MARNLNKILLSMFPGVVTEDLVERDTKIRKQKSDLLISEKISDETRKELEKGLTYLNVEKTHVTQGKVKIGSYHSAIIYCEKIISRVAE